MAHWPGLKPGSTMLTACGFILVLPVNERVDRFFLKEISVNLRGERQEEFLKSRKNLSFTKYFI